MDAIFELLTDLSTDPYLQDAYRRDPEAVMRRAGLSASQQARFLARDAAPVAGWQPCTTTGDPGPDPFEDPDPPEPPVLRR